MKKLLLIREYRRGVRCYVFFFYILKMAGKYVRYIWGLPKNKNGKPVMTQTCPE